MKKTLVILAMLLVSGCAGQDALTIQNMERFRQVWEEDRKPVVDDDAWQKLSDTEKAKVLAQAKIDARNFEFDQALKHERSK